MIYALVTIIEHQVSTLLVNNASNTRQSASCTPTTRTDFGRYLPSTRLLNAAICTGGRRPGETCIRPEVNFCIPSLTLGYWPCDIHRALIKSRL